ncbi:MAG: hypothetical protein EPN14_01625 [Gallionella sp.]|nr:MAG: hypothetical protein EPN14_01625 [Gallionella sp.]
MRAKKIVTNLLLCVAIGLPQYASAALFCPVTPDGKIHIDECKYPSNDECKRATGNQGDCVADQLPPSDKAPYCLVTLRYEECDKYFDYESCSQAAQKELANCTINPRYKKTGQ